MYLFQAARRASFKFAFRRFATSPAEGKQPPVSFKKQSNCDIV